MKLILLILLVLLQGCAVTDLDNVIRINEGNFDTGIPYFNPKGQGCSLQSQGHIDYDFELTYKTEVCTMSVIKHRD